MRFRSIFIKNFRIKLIIFTAIIALTAAVFILFAKKDSVPVFNEKNDSEYIEILDSGLIHKESKQGIVQKIKEIIGFNTDKPETIISDFSPVFDDKPKPEVTEPPQATESPAHTEHPKEEQKSAPVQFPSKQQILTAEKLEINNATSYSVDLKELCAKENSFSIERNSAEPQILIIHTHTTECFDGDAMNGETERNTNEEKNIVAVGNVIAQTLEQNGIHCVHDKTVHDYPSYQGAYTRELSTINYNLKQYPSIKAVIDVHRDAYIYPDGSKLTVKYDRNGVSTARVMLVIGTDSLGLSHPNWRDNLSFASKIQNAADIMYPGMMRPINLRRERFNMHTTKGSILIEIGSNGNTLAEAKEGGKNIANSLSAVLLAE